MDFIGKASDVATSIVISIIMGFGAGIGWVVRRLLTNQKQIEMLSSELDARDVLRQEMRKVEISQLEEVQADVREIRAILMSDKG